MNPLAFFAACTNEFRFLGIQSWYKYLEREDQIINGELVCDIDFDFPDDIWLIVAALIEIALRIAVLAALAFFIYGAIRLILSRGEPEGLVQARNTMINALVGLIIALIATGLVTFIAGRVG